MRSRPPATALRAGIIAIGLALGWIVPTVSAADPCPAPAPPMRFEKPVYVDEARAGGEPSIVALQDGSLLYGAHAGTTHFYTPDVLGPSTSAFVQNYTGQTYYWRSADHGKTWTYIPRALPSNAPFSGFSDPDFAIDKAGQVYISEINLVNVAMSKSTDGGKSYALQNLFAMTLTDRQWSEADEKDVVYLVGNASGGGTSTNPVGNSGHFLYKSKDGGVTFTPGTDDGDGLGDLQVDRSDGTLYEAYHGDGTLSMAAFRKARQDVLTPEINPIAKGVGMLSHWPAIDIDRKGNLYIVWDESGRGEAKRPAGVYYSYSTDRGKTWAKPVRVDDGPGTDIWPYIAVGTEGRVAIAWFGTAGALPDQDAETPGDHGWHVYAAQTITGLGCGNGKAPKFRVTQATDEPFHHGTICMGGTVCQAQLIDRRLGDYFTIDIDPQGRLVAAYSDTRKDGSVALGAFLRQSSGESFIAAAQKAKAKPTTAVKGTKKTRPLPATGVGWPFTVAWSFVGVALILALWRRRHA
ncbi:MAG: sialidase family protein [Actinomycetota bacterium]